MSSSSASALTAFSNGLWLGGINQINPFLPPPSFWECYHSNRKPVRHVQVLGFDPKYHRISSVCVHSPQEDLLKCTWREEGRQHAAVILQHFCSGWLRPLLPSWGFGCLNLFNTWISAFQSFICSMIVMFITSVLVSKLLETWILVWDPCLRIGFLLLFGWFGF